MRVIFIHGPAASGKHTIGFELSRLIHLPLFHNHLTVDLVHTLFEFGSEPFRFLRAEIWRQAFATAAAAGRSFIFTFHPEATVDRSVIDELRQLVENKGGEVLFVELRCGSREILQRLDNPSRKEFGKLTDADLYRTIEAQGGFDFPAMPEPWMVIDTETCSPDDAAKRIAARLETQV